MYMYVYVSYSELIPFFCCGVCVFLFIIFTSLSCLISRTLVVMLTLMSRFTNPPALYRCNDLKQLYMRVGGNLVCFCMWAERITTLLFVCFFFFCFLVASNEQKSRDTKTSPDLFNVIQAAISHPVQVECVEET